jgi:hypothetical protein
MAHIPLSERLHRNSQDQIVLQIAMWHERTEVITLSVYGFVGKVRLERIVLKRQRYPFDKDGMTKAEFAQTCKTLALVVALELGEPRYLRHARGVQRFCLDCT